MKDAELTEILNTINDALKAIHKTQLLNVDMLTALNRRVERLERHVLGTHPLNSTFDA